MSTIQVPSSSSTPPAVERRPWRLLMGSNRLGGTVEIVEANAAVIVRTRYLGSWTRGFEIAELLDDGYLIRRVSDGAVLSDVIAFEDVKRPEDGL